MQIQQFTPAGLEEFRSVIRRARDGVPNNQAAIVDDAFFQQVMEIAKQADLVVPIQDAQDIEPDKCFTTRYELGAYLDERLPGGVNAVDVSKVEMWSWLSAVYLKQICEPRKNSSSRKLWSAYRYIPEASLKRRYYRHLLFMSVWLHRQLGDASAKLFLSTELYKMGEAIEKIYTREKDVTTIPSLMNACLLMYYDEDKKRLRAKATGNGPGSAIRLASVVAKQLSVNFDLFTMTAEQLIELLPPEFNRWKTYVT